MEGAYERPQEHAAKLPMFNGTGDWQAFESHFEHCTARYGWSDDVQLDRLYDCLKDDALSYFCSSV